MSSENILPKESLKKINSGERPKYRISFLGIFFTFILFIILIIFGERVMFDINRYANPKIAQTAYSSDSYTGYLSYDEQSVRNLVYDKSALSSTRLYYSKNDVASYKLYKVLLHLAFVLPGFLITFLLYYIYFIQRKGHEYGILIIGYMSACLWLFLHVLIETSALVLDTYKDLGIYLILLFFVLLFTGLVMLLQKKKNLTN